MTRNAVQLVDMATALVKPSTIQLAYNEAMQLHRAGKPFGHVWPMHTAPNSEHLSFMHFASKEGQEEITKEQAELDASYRARVSAEQRYALQRAIENTPQRIEARLVNVLLSSSKEFES